MAERSRPPKRRKRATAPSRFHLIVRDTGGNVYYIPSDRIGSPIVSATLNAAIEEAVKEAKTSLIRLNFAMLIDEGEAIVRISRRG